LFIRLYPSSSKGQGKRYQVSLPLSLAARGKQALQGYQQGIRDTGYTQPFFPKGFFAKGLQARKQKVIKRFLFFYPEKDEKCNKSLYIEI
jgi:hypothetical protein